MYISRRLMLAGIAGSLATIARSEERMTHIALLGDSVIDNKAYVSGPDVAEQVRMLSPNGWKVSRLARDGAGSSDVLAQLKDLPPDATHLVISAGGNDALGASGVLDQGARSVGDVLVRLADVKDGFRTAHGTARHAAGTRQ